MKNLQVRSLEIPEVKVVRFERFVDDRGYFTEIFRRSQFDELDFLKGVKFVQCNESHSKKNVVRGLHFQWSPYMGKLVRTVCGHMVDMALDIRLGSPTFGQIICHDMPSNPKKEYDEWIWLPPGFAHGNYFLEETTIEYFCSGSYSPNCEAAVSPFANDIDWSMCDPRLKKQFEQVSKNAIVSEKDKQNGVSLSKWQENSNSKKFTYKDLT